jgi:hypothetical protein
VSQVHAEDSNQKLSLDTVGGPQEDQQPSKASLSPRKPGDETWGTNQPTKPTICGGNQKYREEGSQVQETQSTRKLVARQTEQPSKRHSHSFVKGLSHEAKGKQGGKIMSRNGANPSLLNHLGRKPTRCRLSMRPIKQKDAGLNQQGTVSISQIFGDIKASPPAVVAPVKKMRRRTSKRDGVREII